MKKLTVSKVGALFMFFSLLAPSAKAESCAEVYRTEMDAEASLYTDFHHKMFPRLKKVATLLEEAHKSEGATLSRFIKDVIQSQRNAEHRMSSESEIIEKLQNADKEGIFCKHDEYLATYSDIKKEVLKRLGAHVPSAQEIETYRDVKILRKIEKFEQKVFNGPGKMIEMESGFEIEFQDEAKSGKQAR